MFEAQADKQVSVKERDNSRNTTDVPTYVMCPACVNKVYSASRQKVLSVGSLKKYKRRFPTT